MNSVFALVLATQGGVAQRLAGDEVSRRAILQRALEVQWKPGGWNNSFLIQPGAFPDPVWDHPESVREAFGEMEVRVRWFDHALNEVEQAEQPGRYAAYLEARGPDGQTIRRGFTYFCVPEGFQPWRLDFGVALPHLAGSGVGERVWAEQSDSVAEFGRESYLRSLYESPSGAILLAGIHDREREAAEGALPLAPWYGSWVRDQEYHLQLKARIYGHRLEEPFVAPARLDETTPVLRHGHPAEAGIAEELDGVLRELCEAWAEESGIPFTFLVARHGIIVHEGAYGEQGGAPIDSQTRFDIASVSKLITGVMLTRFLDQGLIGLDDPIGKYLPDFPITGERVITIRHAMMHLAGTEGHGTYGGFRNPWFENVVANGLELLEPGKRYLYNGLSMNLVGRVMEMVAGMSFIRLMNEHLYEPLGMHNTVTFDTAFGTRTTAQDLARIGQMLLNEGSYGDRRYFSPEAAKKLLPVRVGDLYPESESPDVVYGLGTSWFHGPRHPDLPEDATGQGSSLLGYWTLSHGSATRSVLRVDFDHGMVIAMARPSGGPDYGRHINGILQAIAGYLEPNGNER